MGAAPTGDPTRLEPRLLETLRLRLGPQAVIDDPSELIVYESDGSTLHDAFPGAVVFPQTTEDVAAVVSACSKFDVSFVARGAGTGLSGGAMAMNGGVIIALNRMRRILEIDVPNRRMTVEPGVTNQALSRAVAADGLYYAPDPSSQAVCTIGGNVAHNSGGPHTLKYGVTVNHVLGLQLVLPDGEIVEIGGPDRPGYDLLALLTGAEGTLGIVTRITVGLCRTPETVRTLLAAFPSVDAACQAVSSIIASGLMPAALEMMDDVVVEALVAAFDFGFPDGASALLLVETDGPAAGLDEEIEQVARLCQQSGAVSVRHAADADERADIWKARKRAFGAIGRIAPNYATQDGVIPRTRLREMLARIADIADRWELRIANVFHAGDGNLHPCILFDDADVVERERVIQAGAEILRACVEMGGSLTGEHGVGLEKREWMTHLFTEADLSVMALLRQTFDPRGLCNPLKILPTGTSCGELSPAARQAAL